MKPSARKAAPGRAPSAKESKKAKSIDVSKEWTIMVYMSGDNNLGQDMIYAIRSLQDALAAKAPDANIMLFFDGNARDTPTVYYDLSDPQNPYNVFAKQITKRQKTGRERSMAKFNENAATMYSIYDFVGWCISKDQDKRGRIARNYALVVSGHGSGFQNLSFLHDERSDYYMTIPKFRETLAWISEDFLGRQKLNLVGFDNCVMGMLEVAHELAPYADYMIASEGNIPLCKRNAS
jgi:hypothetical protein